MFGVMNSAVSVGFIGLDENYRHYANYFLHATIVKLKEFKFTEISIL